MEEIGEVEERGFVIEWTIRDFFSLPEKEDEPYYGSFSFDGARWCLSVYPNGQREKKSEGYVGLYLCRESSGPPIELNCFIGVKTSNNEVAREVQYTHNFDRQFDNYGWIHFLKRSELLERKSELAPSGHLTCVCRLKHPESTDVTNATSTANCAHCKKTVDAGSLSSHETKCVDKPIQCPEGSDIDVLKDWYAHECQTAKAEGDNSASVCVSKSKILEDLKRLLQNQENCDVVLRVKGREFPAHKAILTARSSVFASTFRNDMREKITSVVDIEDCDPYIFSDFLRFLYYEDAEGLSNENVFSLFSAGDKYDVSDLREKCVEFMKENLSVDTFCNTLILAVRHRETELIHLATDFFVVNADKIIVTVQWQTFAAENPSHCNELFNKFVASVKH